MKPREGLRFGLITLGIILFLDLLGLPLTTGSSIVVTFSIMVGLLSFLFLRRKVGQERNLLNALINGLLIGVISGIGLVLVTYLFAHLQANGTRVNQVFAQILPEHTSALTGLTKEEVFAGGNVWPGLFKIFILFTVAGLLGGGLTQLFGEETRQRMDQISSSSFSRYAVLMLPLLFFVGFLVLKIEGVQIGGSEENVFGLVLVFLFIGASLFAFRSAKPGKERIVLAVVTILLMIVLPQLTDLFQNAVLSAVAIFIMMGLGLNVVVGYAGLLDLGYVAFFGIGAYTFGLLAAPESYVLIHIPQFHGVTFWVGLPIAILVGVVTGILLGIPVLRMRGDYLAIVTLGFGEIIRLLLLNLRDFTGGPGGVLDIPAPIVFGMDLGNPKGILYLGMIFSGIVAFLTIRLRDSRLGRSWIALREDEDVAQAMGINLVAIKLLAFATGAAFAAGAGALYASRQVNIFPDNFTLLVSIDVLSLIIIGGLGSIEGVVLGSIALIGLPEILRSVNEYRIVAFGALLVLMMILRPEGLLPSARRQRELRSEETPRPATTSD
jgi:branched-chain amino acid transport system permease protein